MPRVGKRTRGPSTDPSRDAEGDGGADADETTVGVLLETDYERTGMRRTASTPDPIELDVDLARTHSSELPTFERLQASRREGARGPDSTADDAVPVQFFSEPRISSEPPRAVRHAAIDRGESPAPPDADAIDEELALDETHAWRAPPRGNPAELIGKVVAGRYELGPVLGAGGMGTVFQAEHTDLGKRVAIKVLSAVLDGDDEAKQRFIREATAASTIESDHIAQVFDIGEDLHLGLYMVMELLKGQDLSHALAAQGALAIETAVGIAWQVCLALERAHGARVVHRDLKPANVFLTSGDDGSVKVKVLDFGIAKLLRDARKSARGAITGRGLVVGTPQYMSPEQAQGLDTIDHRTDLYSVGALLFESITGAPPFPELESHEQTLRKLLTEAPPRLASRARHAPLALDALVAELMSRNPQQRPRSAKEVRARLEAMFPWLERRTVALSSAPPPPPRPSPAPRVPVVPRTASGVIVDSAIGVTAARARRSRGKLVAGAAALGAAVIAGGGFLVARSGGSPNGPGMSTTLTAAQTSAASPPSTAAPAPPSTGVRALVAAEEEATALVPRADAERADAGARGAAPPVERPK
jgi:serine/threonine protein kinase